MTRADLPTKSWPASPWCPETKLLSSVGLPSPRTSQFQSKATHATWKEVAMNESVYAQRYTYLRICIWIAVSTCNYLYPYACVCAHTHTCTQSECSLCFGNVLWLSAFALNSTTVAAPEIARSNRLHSTEGNSHTYTCKSSHTSGYGIIFNPPLSTLQWIAIERCFRSHYLYAISHRNQQKFLSFMNVDKSK